MNTEQIKNIREKLDIAKTNNYSEENTKMSIIRPILQLLGYDVFNPEEVNNEVNSVVDGTIKYERIDMAIYLNSLSKPTIILEAKAINVKLDKKHRNQLYRYFTTLNPKIAILTNGEEWWFYTDLDNQNLMDEEPYLKLNIYNDADLEKLESYNKRNILDIDIKSEISNLKLKSSVEQFFEDMLNSEFSDSFLEYIKNNYDLNSCNFKSKQIKRALSDGVVNFSKKLAKKESNALNLKEFYEKYEVYENDYLNNVYLLDKRLEISNYTSLFVDTCVSLIDSNPKYLNMILSSDVWTNTMRVSKGRLVNEKETFRYNDKYDISFVSHTDTKTKLSKLIKLFDSLNIDMNTLVFKVD